MLQCLKAAAKGAPSRGRLVGYFFSLFNGVYALFKVIYMLESVFYIAIGNHKNCWESEEYAKKMS